MRERQAGLPQVVSRFCDAFSERRFGVSTTAQMIERTAEYDVAFGLFWLLLDGSGRQGARLISIAAVEGASCCIEHFAVGLGCWLLFFRWIRIRILLGCTRFVSGTR